MGQLARLYLGANTRTRIEEIGQHYAQEDADLARRAVYALIAALDSVKADGGQGAIVRGMMPGHRKVQAIPFPYWIVYHVDPDQNEGFVVDIRHSKQRVMKPKAARRSVPEPVRPALPPLNKRGAP